MKEFEPVIGLEVHIQLNTKTKLFCSCSTRFGAEPNTQTCPVCLGLPGVLPVFNRKALDKCVTAGLALNATIAQDSKFDRKNYFYPDLPKAYQISQYDRPVCTRGSLEIHTDKGAKTIGITRLHLEEDAGKLIHSNDRGTPQSYVDLNRAGIPLVEIVSEPDIRTGDEAYAYLQKIKMIMKYLDVSDVNMEEGSLRCDVNISVREQGVSALGRKVEIKNLNSFKAVRAAIHYETNRQISALEAHERIKQETRLWDDNKSLTYSMREKEYAHDYRYFPEPDIPPIQIAENYIEKIKKILPELPDAKKKRFIEQYGLSEYDAAVLTSVRELADYFENVVAYSVISKKAANWIISEMLAVINAEDIPSFPITPAKFASMLKLIEDGTISGKIAKTVFQEMIATGVDASTIIEKKGLKQITDAGQIETIIDTVIAHNLKTVEEYKQGKEKALKFLIGQVMKESKGTANPALVHEMLVKKLLG